MADSSPDSAAVAEWVRKALDDFERPLVRYAQRITGDAERARDVVQETFLRLCRQTPAELDGRLAEWLFTVCRNQALDVRRKERRMTTVADSAALRESPEAPPAQAAEDRDAAASILEILDTLPENQQEVIRLKFQNSISYREISGVTGLSVSNVGYLMHHGLQAIRRKLQTA
ncbi:MAG: sigma-70 family RNA polymerase sigma factor [Planctomycetes bacterium]|nr:sigma-70 family RNA polymerase sigma factor [Planctomycetota bacterium]